MKIYRRMRSDKDLHRNFLRSLKENSDGFISSCIFLGDFAFGSNTFFKIWSGSVLLKSYSNYVHNYMIYNHFVNFNDYV